jgi:tetratricopeptide (TPR) repeat protein
VVIDTPPVVTPPSLPTDVSELDALLLQAESYLSYGMSENTLGRRLVFPDDESAVGLFRQALQLDPNNAQANEGLRMVAEFYATRAAKMCERTLWDACRTSASDGLQADPQRADLLELMHRAERGIRGD